MPNPLETFADSAKTLSKNPLGIIALFIVLVYAMASLVLGIAGSHLQPFERIPLIYFLVIFPLIVLGVFGWLVSCHHLKLYAPSDYRDEANFIRSLTPEEQRVRINEEVQALILPTECLPDVGSDTLPEPSIARSAVASAFLAEDLVLRQLQSEFGTALHRNSVISAAGKRIELDGVVMQPNAVTAVEVKFFRSPIRFSNRLRDIRAVADRAESVFRAVGDSRPFRLLLAVVTDAPSDKHSGMLDQLVSHLGSDPRIEIRIFSFDELKQRFGIELANS